jgi:hypothetical protein
MPPMLLSALLFVAALPQEPPPVHKTALELAR